MYTESEMSTLIRVSVCFLKDLVIEAEIAYSGGFHLSVDVDFVFGKSAYLSVIVTKLEGTVHIHLTRLPFTHWSMSFIEVNLLAAYQIRPQLPYVSCESAIALSSLVYRFPYHAMLT